MKFFFKLLPVLLVGCIVSVLVVPFPVNSQEQLTNSKKLEVANQSQQRSLNDIISVLNSRNIDASKLENAKKTLAEEIPVNLESKDLADFYLKRSRAANELGLIGPQIGALRKVIELGGGREPHRAWAELSGAEFNGGNFRSALAAKEKSLEVTPNKMQGFQLSVHTQIADMYRRIGDFETAKKHIRDAEGLLVLLKKNKNWVYYQNNWQGAVEDALGRIALTSGHYEKSIEHFRNALTFREKDVIENIERIRLNLNNNPSQNIVENHRDASEAWLASALRMQGNLNDAEIHARKLAYRCIEKGGLESLHTNLMMQQLVLVLMEKNRSKDALLLVDQIIKNLDKLGVPKTAYTYVNYRRIRANALTSQKKWSEAIEEFESLSKALASDPQLIETLGAPSLGWIRSLIALKRFDEAIALSEKLARQKRELLGQTSYESAEAAGYYGVALASAGRNNEAFDVLHQAVKQLTAPATENFERSGQRFGRLSYIIENYLRVLDIARSSQHLKLRGIDPAAEAFLVTDALRGKSVQQAMASSSARAAANSPELSNLVREEQDIRQERDSLNKILADLMARPADQMLPSVIADMQKRVNNFDLQIKDLTEKIKKRFPDYADLISPKPASIAQVQSVLKTGETLFTVLPINDRTFIWAIPAKGNVAFATSQLSSAEISRLVYRVRTALDVKNVDFEALPLFDSSAALQLYNELMLPVQSGWLGSKHLIVAAGGALSHIPFSLLLTSPPSALMPTKGSSIPYSNYEQWPWLIKDFAISQLPAASSLTTLRRMKAGSTDRLAFAGFGDPDFLGDKNKNAANMRSIRSAALPLNLRATSSNEVDAVDYSRIAALPETRDEILALSKTLGADHSRDVFLGSAASKNNVLTMDLSKRKVIAFATHGLLSGEFPGINQPALALSNPGNGSHGLLTLDDILGLKLDADWVILSACNSAGGDAEDSDAVSGLGRGFFYAGSRSLLLTHWPVESVSAQKLVVGIFDASVQQPLITRAEALRESMLGIMKKQDGEGSLSFSYAHPLFWAPYALVGDGGK